MKAKNKLLLGMMLFTFMIGYVSAYSTNQFNNSLTNESITFSSQDYNMCYQESANVSNQAGTDGSCGLSYSGAYSFVGNNWGYSTNNIIDGNFGTYSYNSLLNPDNIHSVYINYTKPSGATSSIWRVKDGSGTYNLTINSNCFSQYADRISLKIDLARVNPANNYITFNCYNSSGWGILRNNSIGSGSLSIYEEGFYWNVTAVLPATRYLSIPTTTTVLTNAFLNLSVISSQTIPIGYSHYYSFDNAKDVNNTLDFTATGSPTYITGLIGNGYNKTIGNYLTTNRTDYNFSIGGTNRTINFWVKPQVAPTGATYVAGQKDVYYININSSLHLGWAMCGNNNNGSLSTSEWTMITIIKNDTGTNCYLNGTLTSKGTATQPGNSNVVFTLGWYDGANGDKLNATFDELGVWTRVLNSSEISDLYNAGVGITYNTTSSVSLTNVTLNVGNNEVFKSNINNSNKTNNFASVINKFLNSTYQIGSNYLIPFNFNTDTLGTLTYSGLIFNDSYYMSLCSGANNITYVNYSFADANNGTILNATMTLFNSSYYLTGYPNTTKYYNFTETNPMGSYALCVSPSDLNVTINYNANYKYSANGYNAPNIVSEILSLTNATTNKILYLSDVARLVAFQVTDIFAKQVSDAYIYITDYYSAGSIVVASGYTDSSGIFNAYLDNVTTYGVYVIKAGYDNFNQLQIATDTFYTIILSGSGINITIPNDYSNVAYRVTPLANYLNNNTYYNFSFSVSSPSWTFDSFGFNLTDEDSNLIDVVSSTSSTGGTVYTNVSTQDFTKVVMNYYFVINGTTINGNREWLVIDLSQNTYSIKRLLDDFVVYIGSGLYGLTTRGLSFIVFFLIFGVVGILSFKYGFDNPVAICGIIFTLVYLFDIVLGWIPQPIQALPHLATWLIMIVFAGMLIREVSNG